MKKILCIIIIFLMTGCWNYHELNNLAITTAIAIDKKGDKFEVSILVANSKKSENSSLGNNESQTIVYSGTGKSIAEALNEIDLLSPKKLYIEHLSILVVSKEIAEYGLIDVFDFFLRNSESSKRFQVALADNAKDVIKILKPLEAFPASSISKNFKLSDESQAKSALVLYSDFLYSLIEKGINPVLPTISIIGEADKGSKSKSLEQTTPAAITKLDNMVLFKKDKMVTIANEIESKGINIVNSKINQMNIYLNCNNGITSIQILDLNTKIKYQNKLNFKIIVQAEGSIIEDTCKEDLTKSKIMRKLEKKGSKEIKKMINKSILLAKKYKTDIFGFGNLLYKNNSQMFNQYNDWDNDAFPNISINIDVNLTIRFKGSANQNIKEAINED